MEKNLEVKTSEEKYFSKVFSEKAVPMPLYKGLELIKEENFKGKTSIVYWM